MPAPYLPCRLVGHDAYSCGSIASRSHPPLRSPPRARDAGRSWIHQSIAMHARWRVTLARALLCRRSPQGKAGPGRGPRRRVTWTTWPSQRRPSCGGHHGAGLVPPGPQRVRVTPHRPAPHHQPKKRGQPGGQPPSPADACSARVDMLATVAVARGCRIAN